MNGWLNQRYNPPPPRNTGDSVRPAKIFDAFFLYVSKRIPGLVAPKPLIAEVFFAHFIKVDVFYDFRLVVEHDDIIIFVLHLHEAVDFLDVYDAAEPFLDYAQTLWNDYSSATGDREQCFFLFAREHEAHISLLVNAVFFERLGKILRIFEMRRPCRNKEQDFISRLRFHNLLLHMPSRVSQGHIYGENTQYLDAEIKNRRKNAREEP